jgi:moderate conductance mechanosensitive channel
MERPSVGSRIASIVGLLVLVTAFYRVSVGQEVVLGQLQEPQQFQNTSNDLQQGPTDAERIAELKESLEHDQKQLRDLEDELENTNSEYSNAERDFRQLNSDYESSSEQLAKLKANANPTSSDSEAITGLEKEVASLERQRKLAKDRFDLAIEDRKTVREQKATLKRKIENDTEALEALTGAGEQPKASEEELESTKTERNHRSDQSDHESKDPSAEHSKDDDASDAREKGRDEPPSSEEDEEIRLAAQEAELKEHEAEHAQEETKSIAARLADIQKLVAQEQRELDLARKRVDLSTAAQLALTQELDRRQSEKADVSELNELRKAIGQANNRLIQARSEVSQISDRLNDHRAEQSSLQSEHILALHEMEKKRQEAAAAEDRVESLRNPFTIRNMLQWAIEHGPRLLVIVAGMFLFNRLASFFAHRSVRLVTAGAGRGSKAERENRAKTLVGVFQNAATVAIFISGTLMMLEEVGANITVLMGGVAVIGLAVAFGAQNLIKDYFYGFVMLLENQYMLNDSVRIGGVSGQVERITLRMTVLRDSSGVVHFIPNGTINSVSNETHGWSRAVCEVTVSHSEDIDRVFASLREVSSSLKNDSVFGSLLMDAPSDPAIENIGETGILLKMSAKTLPNKHGAFKQEWLKRIKRKLDELGIAPAVPERRIRLQSAEQDPTSNESMSSLRRVG